MKVVESRVGADVYSRLLKRIADELLVNREDDDRLSAGVAELYTLCSTVAGLVEGSTRADELFEIGLPDGKAIAPLDAARCVLDYRRTAKFLRGIHAAILEAQKRFPGAAIEILYAGCGPFAPLAIPLTSQFSSEEIRFTLLDIHRRSLDAAQTIFQTFGLDAFVRDYIECDAASFKHDAPHVIHIVVAEAMQAALEKEPQVAITANLAPQLCPGGIFIPQKISVDSYLCDPATEFATRPVEAEAASSSRAERGRDKVRIKLGSVLELNAASYRDLSADGSGEQRGAVLFPETILDVPKDLVGEFNLMLLTTINVFDSITLSDCESGLTRPRILYDLGQIRSGMRIEIAYHPGDNPGFTYSSL